MDKIVHEQTRLKILARLATGEPSIRFTELKESLEMTGGNLSIQLKTLEQAGYIAGTKYRQDNKTRTEYTLTDAGRDALADYLDEMEALLAGIRSTVPKPKDAE